MKRSRFTEQQIIAVLRQAESGTAVEDLCRRAGISTVKFYKGGRRSTRACKSAKCVPCACWERKMGSRKRLWRSDSNVATEFPLEVI